jgi:hypothetical protein
MAKKDTVYIGIYSAHREYGGPEEGGWYYTAWELEDVVEVEPMVPIYFEVDDELGRSIVVDEESRVSSASGDASALELALRDIFEQRGGKDRDVKVAMFMQKPPEELPLVRPFYH